LINSRYPLVCATPPYLRTEESRLFRSYACNLPSSFSIVLSSALVYSTCPPVSVSGTVYKEELFPGTAPLPFQSDKVGQLVRSVTTSRLTNINVIPIDYAFRPRLRSRLTLLRLTLSRNPWTFGGGVSHTPYVTHVSIRTSDTSRRPHGSPFTGLRNAPLPLTLADEPKASVYGFSPVTFSAQRPLFRPVSCYAFFK
jgi:hypothetical protein